MLRTWVGVSALVVSLTFGSRANAQVEAYVLDRGITSDTYAPEHQYNRATLRRDITVSNLGAGRYYVRIPSLGGPGGTVHVTAGPHYAHQAACKVASWGYVGAEEWVNVRCSRSDGAPTTSQFSMVFMRLGAAQNPFGYVWADNATSASYTPHRGYQYNSTGGVNTVSRTGTGRYTVRLPGLGAAAGHVQVTAYGTGTQRCKVASWHPDFSNGANELVNVRCFNASGSPTDSMFTMSFTQPSGMFSSCGSTGRSVCGAYAWANQPTAAWYSPHTSYQFNSLGSAITIRHTATGVYAVRIPGRPADGGNLQVTAYGSGAEYCRIGEWYTGVDFTVTCFNSGGVKVDTLFDVLYLSGR